MWLNLLVVFVVLLIAYIWASRGFFSALLHLACAIVAGAIAFALWEPIGYALLGTNYQGLQSAAFGIGLALPFVVSLAIIRVAVDKIVPKNTDLDGVTNLIGGGVCGAISGVLTAGILVLSLGHLRLGPSLMGYRPIGYDTRTGSLVRNENLWIPVDSLTAGFYSLLSTSTFYPTESGGETLARWHPDLDDAHSLMRITYEGKARNSFSLKDFQFLGQYRLEPADAAELFADTFNSRPQTFVYADGQQPPAGSSVIEGFVVRFKPSARDQIGSGNAPVIIGNGQVRLVVQTDPTDPNATMGVQPLAMISYAQPDPEKPDERKYARWRFDAQDIFIPSVTAQDESSMAFEFVVPRNSRPIALYVKGARVDLTQSEPFTTFTSASSRDEAIRSGSLMPEGPVQKIDWAGAVTIKKVEPFAGGDSPVRVSDGLMWGKVIQKDNRRSLQIDDQNRITDGDEKFRAEEIQNRGIEPKLAVRRFASGENSVLVQITVDGSNSQFGFLSPAAAPANRDGAPVLVDAAGQRYSPVGYMYDRGSEFWVRFTPQNPIRSVSALPSITISRPNDKLVLVYRVTKGQNIMGFAIGETGVAKFEPAVPTVQKTN